MYIYQLQRNFTHRRPTPESFISRDAMDVMNLHTHVRSTCTLLLNGITINLFVVDMALWSWCWCNVFSDKLILHISLQQMDFKLTKGTSYLTLKSEHWSFFHSYFEMEMSFWWNYCHWLHHKLSKWEFPMQAMTKKLSKWNDFHSVNTTPPICQPHN